MKNYREWKKGLKPKEQNLYHVLNGVGCLVFWPVLVLLITLVVLLIMVERLFHFIASVIDEFYGFLTRLPRVWMFGNIAMYSRYKKEKSDEV